MLRLLGFVRRYFEGILLTVLLALVLRLFVVSSFFVPNNIMAPTLLPGDYVLAYKLPYGIRIPLLGSKFGHKMPERGELVVFPCPESRRNSCVRRVVGLPGDRIEIKGERLVVNGEMAKYSSLNPHRAGVLLRETAGESSRSIAISGRMENSRFGPMIVAPGKVFLLSDHRDLGEDSRGFGSLDVNEIEASVRMVWLSWVWPTESNAESNWLGVRWSRVFHSPD